MAGVTVVTLNWNSFDDTRDCLVSLERSTFSFLDVVVVDNASSDDSADRLTEWLAEVGMLRCVSDYSPEAETLVERSRGEPTSLPVHLIRASENTGFCVGNNLGMQLAYSADRDYALILNNDTIADSEMISELVRVAVDTNAGLVGGVILYETQRDLIWWAGGSFDKNLESHRLLEGQTLAAVEGSTPYQTEWISGCMTLIPRRTFERYGGYDEDFFIWSEEWDLSLRVAKGGESLVVAPTARLYHKVGQSLGVMYPLSYYYGTRNRLLLKKKHLPALRRMSYVARFVLTRVPRYGQLFAQGRRDLVVAGVSALFDYFRGTTGRWSRHDGYGRPPAAAPDDVTG